MGRRTKYKPSYAKELLAGLRAGPDMEYLEKFNREYSWSIQRLCWKWGISEQTYYNWIAEFTSFREAHEKGCTDYNMYWMMKIEDGVALGKSANGSLLKLIAANTLGWTDKKEVQQKSDEKIHRIIFETVEPKLIEQQSNVIDITPELKQK